MVWIPILRNGKIEFIIIQRVGEYPVPWSCRRDIIEVSEPTILEDAFHVEAIGGTRFIIRASLQVVGQFPCTGVVDHAWVTLTNGICEQIDKSMSIRDNLHENTQVIFSPVTLVYQPASWTNKQRLVRADAWFRTGEIISLYFTIL